MPIFNITNELILSPGVRSGKCVGNSNQFPYILLHYILEFKSNELRGELWKCNLKFKNKQNKIIYGPMSRFFSCFEWILRLYLVVLIFLFCEV